MSALRVYRVTSAGGWWREWEAEDEDHAREQHDDAFGTEEDEAIVSIEQVGGGGGKSADPCANGHAMTVDRDRCACECGWKSHYERDLVKRLALGEAHLREFLIEDPS